MSLLFTYVNGQIIGSYRPGAKVVNFFWKNKAVGRLLANRAFSTMTTFQNTVKAKMNEFATRFSDILTAAQKSEWDAYAASLYDPTAGQSTGGNMYVIPRRKKVISGINAYIGNNITEFLADGTGPDDTAPLGDPSAAPPTNVSATGSIAMGITVTWIDPVVVGTPSKKFIRVWAKSTTKPKAHAQYLGTVAFALQTFNFTTMRRGRYSLPLVKGTYRVQCDAIRQESAGRGCVTGPGSNVFELAIT